MKLLILLAAYIGLVYLIGQILKDFIIHQKDKTWIVGIALFGVDYLIGTAVTWILQVLAFLPKLITLGLFNLVFNLAIAWAAALVVLWATDKFSKTLEIRNARTLYIAAIIFAVAKAIIYRIV